MQGELDRVFARPYGRNRELAERYVTPPAPALRGPWRKLTRV